MSTLYRKLAIAAFITLIAVTIGTAVAVFMVNYDATTASLQQVLLQAEDEYRAAYHDNEVSATRQETDFRGRATAIAFMLQRDPSLMTNEGLEELRLMLKVAQIDLFDAAGNVLLSTRSDRRGDHVEAGSKLERYLLSPEAPRYAVYWQTDESGLESRRCSVAMRPAEAPFHAIHVVMERGVHRVMDGDGIMRGLMRDIVTRYETTVVAFSDETGEIIGITANNPQELHARDRQGKEIDLLEAVRRLEKGEGCVRLDEGDAIAVSVQFDGYTLVGFVSMSTLLLGMILPLLVMVAVTLAFGGLMFYRVRMYWRRYLLHDLHTLEEDIYSVLSGDLHRQVSCTRNEDLASLAEAFNALREGYEHREERLSRIASCLGGGVAIFDCTKRSGMNFFSDNMRETLGMSRREWDTLRGDYRAFNDLLDRLLDDRDENGIIHFHNRHLDIRMTRDKSGVSGIVIDASEEVARHDQLLRELNKVSAAVRRDGMTGLLNRAGFEQEVLRHLNEEDPVGVMLMMDMDNFKNVNDTLGHPEGDRLICLVGDSLRCAFRRSDVVSHFGGDEFAAFLPNAISLDDLERKLTELLERLRLEMCGYHESCGTTMSIGAAFVHKNGSYADLYQRADSALYIAKNMGKDRFYINSDDIACMRMECVACREECPRREVLDLTVSDEEIEQE
ncbi:MAG: GGDEF domain-containing protein [Eubacteriales bacterium]|nr:GGDEF domain-containing protein [Eubacteriales bacterium]